MKEAIVKSITSTMQGKTPSEEDVTALHAYLTTLKAPPNPFKSGGKLSDAAERGKKIFFSAKAACADCHDGPHFTDGKIHEVGLESASDRYRGYNTPTLVGSFRRVRFFHNGSARSLEQVLTDRHSPEKVNGEAPLSEQELADLIEYLKTL
jgi:cytochrome c peroxidase